MTNRLSSALHFPKWRLPDIVSELLLIIENQFPGLLMASKGATLAQALVLLASKGVVAQINFAGLEFQSGYQRMILNI